ncbi:MAG TPA: alpha/beta hydrolase [Chthoniobacteraceae bacterium]|jgi:poly(3-hydroxybutyrate) depolymerase|nr:alpha/beta hydrolase [Chthoniobacteraceae bacterium]
MPRRPLCFLPFVSLVRVLGLCLAVGFFGLPCFAEPAAAERGVVLSLSYHFEEAKKDLSYALYVPTKYDAVKAAPLVVLLHGLGSNPQQVMRYQGIIEEAEKRGYVVVAPYGYNEFGGYGAWGQGRARLPGQRAPAAGEVPENLGELSEKDVLNVLALVRRNYRIDPKRIYLMGHSMGGGGTLHLGMTHPEFWAALAPLSPAIFSAPAGLEKIRKMPIIVVQGELDRLVQAAQTRRWIEMMEKLKMEYRYLEIKGGDHILSICANPKMMAEVFEFFDKHP